MPTNVRPEVSEKNPYYIDRERYYELKHFCRQYPIWKKAYRALDGMVRTNDNLGTLIDSNVVNDPTSRSAVARDAYLTKMELVEKCAREASSELYVFLMKYVTSGDTYTVLKMRDNIPCGKDAFYTVARKFFWLLSKVRN